MRFGKAGTNGTNATFLIEFVNNSNALIIGKNNTVTVRARLYDDFAEHEIVLNSVITYWWANDLPPAVKFLELFESVIKRTINELTPHKNLNLKFNLFINPPIMYILYHFLI